VVLLSCLLTLLESFNKNNPAMGTDSVARQIHKKTVQHSGYWVSVVKPKVTKGGSPTLRLGDTLIQLMEAALNQAPFLTQAQALLGKAIGENAKVKSIINKDYQVAPKQIQLGVRLAVNTHNMGGRFVESVKNARRLMSPQEAGDFLESIVEFQVQIKEHSQQEYDNKWQDWQNWTDEKLATKLTKAEQQLVLLLPARWWPDTLLDGIVSTNADPRYAGKLDDPQEGDATMLMQQVREVMTVNQEMNDESSWIWLERGGRKALLETLHTQKKKFKMTEKNDFHESKQKDSST